MRKSNMLRALFAAGALPGAPLAGAQDRDESGIAEIVVTAERRSAEIQTVPLSVVAITDEDIRSLVLRESVDLASAVPGLQFDKQGLGATPFIRGVGTMSGAIGNETSVSTYVDGVYYATPNASIFGLSGVQQIEVLKGPQGTLFGRNATGGVVQVVTRDPERDPFAEVQLRYGSDSTAGASLYATQGFGDSLAASLSLSAREQDDGWGTNLVTGERTFVDDERVARGKLSWTPGSQTRVVFGVSHFDRQGEQGIGLHIVPGALGVDGQSSYPGFFNSVSDPQDQAEYRQSVVSARLERDFAAFRLVSISSWQEMDSFFLLDQDGTPLQIVEAPISQYGRTVTQEVQLLSRPEAPLVWIAGFYYLNDDSAYDPLRLEGAVALPLSALEIHAQQRSQSYALFGQTTLTLTERAHLTLGSRYTRDERRIAGTTLGFAGATGVPLAQAQQSAEWEEPTYRAALAFDVTPELMAYVSWDRGFKSGVYNLLAYASLPVSPEELDAYQAGVKSDWLDDRLRLNASAFTYRYENIQVEAVVAGATIALNAAAARMRGLDLELEYAPSSAFTLRAAIAFLHGRYSDFPNAPITAPARDASGKLIGGNTLVSGDASGLQTVRSPTRTASLSGRYRMRTRMGEVGFSAGYYHNSGFAWDPDNRVRQSAFGLSSASVDWTSLSERIAVRAAGSNLNDAEVCLFGTTPSLGDFCSPRAPRAFSVDVTMTF